MQPISIKRKAQLPSEVENSFEYKQQVGDAARYTFTSKQFKYKCTWGECEKPFNNSDLLRSHYRTHTKAKPYKCSFPGCKTACVQSSSIFRHIYAVHLQQTQIEAKKYVDVQKDILTEEAKLLGINNKLTKKNYGEAMFDGDDDEIVMLPKLPHFTVIHRVSTGQYVCPVSACDHHARKMNALRRHYRTHCKSAF